MIACYKIEKEKFTAFAKTAVVYPKDFLQLSFVFEDSWRVLTL